MTEDRYGVVQRDIPKILEAMVSLLSAIEEYQREIDSQSQRAQSEPTSKGQASLHALAVEATKSKEILSYMEDGESSSRQPTLLSFNTLLPGLREGIARIVRTFGDKLLAFKFPLPVAQKLQTFLEYA